MAVEWQGNPVIILYKFSNPESTFYSGYFKGLTRQAAQCLNPFPTLQLAVLKGYREYNRENPMLKIRFCVALFHTCIFPKVGVLHENYYSPLGITWSRSITSCNDLIFSASA